MPIRRLRLQNFRNVEFADLELVPGFNGLIGANGAGKTSVLEAVYLMGRGRSFRSTFLDTLIQNDAKGLSVSIDLETPAGVDSVLIAKARKQALSLRINGQRAVRLSEAASKLPLQLFTPGVSDLVLAGPAERRQYLDWGLFHVEHRYHPVARDYSRALKQRNTWLRDSAGLGSKVLDPWRDVLSELAVQLDTFRQEYCTELFESIVCTAQSLDVGLEIDFSYEKGWRAEVGRSFSDQLLEGTAGDLSSGTTRIGPHRADIHVKTRQRAASDFLSRGQAKLVAIAMKVAQIEVLKRRTGRQSTVLFDELIAELDYQRTTNVLEMLERLGCQVIFSSVELPDAIKSSIGNRAHLFHVKQGAITALEE